MSGTAPDATWAQWRDLTPSDAMNRAGLPWFCKLMHYSGFMASIPNEAHYDPIMCQWIEPADLIIFQRNVIQEGAVEAIKYWQDMGKPVAIDLDDAYIQLPHSNPAYQYWYNRGLSVEDRIAHLQDPEAERKLTDALKTLHKGLSVSAGLISPNRNMLRTYAHLTDGRGYYLQNYAEKKWWEPVPELSRQDAKKRIGLDPDRIYIGWGGSMSHYDSFFGSEVYDALEIICQRNPQVSVLICGNDRRIYDRLPVPESQKAHHPGVPPDEWPKIVRSYDIGLAPLFSEYDQHRSWIKGIEYALAGVPWVGTAGGPDGTYTDLLKGGNRVRLVQNGKLNWLNALTEILDNLEEEQAVAEAFIPQAQRLYIVDYNLDVYYRVYSKVIEDFQRLGNRGSSQDYVLPGVMVV